MDAFLLVALLKPMLYFALYVGVIYWLVKLAWSLIPDGRLKAFLFKRR